MAVRAPEVVIARAAKEQVVARPAAEQVIAVAAAKRIVSRAAENLVVPRASLYDVVYHSCPTSVSGPAVPVIGGMKPEAKIGRRSGQSKTVPKRVAGVEDHWRGAGKLDRARRER
ncbi:MAG: hypothetical protein U5K36_06015 [Roseovarius sp.]|nr:hypothetical protein [Roseovarius sp.]